MDLGKPLKSTGGANLSDTLPPFQLILVGVHWRQIGQRLENLVQSAPACQQLCSSFSLAQHGWPDYPVTFSLIDNVALLWNCCSIKPTPLCELYMPCAFTGALSVSYMSFPTHIALESPLERCLVVVIWEPTSSALNRHRRSAIYCVTIPLLRACSLLSFTAKTTPYRAQTDLCCTVTIYFACVPKEVCIINVTC